MAEPRKNKVLVVDDDEEVREVASEFLAVEGFEVLHAANGLEALLQVKRERPHAVVLDLSMPRLGGLDTLKRIRKFDASIRVVVVTASTESDLHQQALALGAVRVLTKPLALRDLKDALAPT